ncbi:MAG: DHA2 family efflux MFS transporter permease subunit [Firmicutes bacterium]|jgi:EmrB/QacA subfamily drug resistance transporter|uniref:MFS transporter n=1 Tax=Sulfobacillus benefaciens TaxID=453960 RepID=A0A2T2X7Z6_9FIRM|nr:DHA2 family efflux MFS transporter permease subunit [Bacillota bacterium]MCL5014093.1 DHA2 family efflux MFS transporter permease subunit [Bacillota bacterium]PSR30568.1 MAG: MFS transporter [Sulfobacillus benefaciens]
MAQQDSSTITNNWGVALAVLITGGFMAILDTSIVNIAIPKLESVFSVNTAQVQWVVTIYMLTLGVVVPLAGYLGERFGYRRIYVVSLAIFTVGSALSGLSWSLSILTMFRVLQALGGGLIMPITMAMVYRMVPRQRIGTAMGFWGLGIIVAPAIGPALGGWLVQYVDWRLIFYINVPIGIVGALLALAYVPKFPRGVTGPFDFMGFMLSALGLFGLLLALSEGQTWGWGSEAIVLLLTSSILLLILFTLWELTVKHPLLNLRVFAHGSFAMANILVIVITVSMYSGVFYVPLFLQTVAGYGALKTGLMMMPAALASAVMMPLSGRLYDRIGARPVVLVGLVILAYTTFLLHGLSTTTPVSDVVLWLTFRGLGMGMAMMPATTAGMSAVPTALVGSGSAINNIMQRVAGSFGLAFMTAVLQSQATLHATTLAASYTPASQPAMQFMHQLSGYLHQHGILISQTVSMTTSELYHLIQEQAFVMGIDDIFVLGAAITLLGALLSLFLRTYRHQRAQG